MSPALSCSKVTNKWWLNCFRFQNGRRRRRFRMFYLCHSRLKTWVFFNHFVRRWKVFVENLRIALACVLKLSIFCSSSIAPLSLTLTLSLGRGRVKCSPLSTDTVRTAIHAATKDDSRWVFKLSSSLTVTLVWSNQLEFCFFCKIVGYRRIYNLFNEWHTQSSYYLRLACQNIG